MADIHIEEKLDRIDYITVALYRCSFVLSAMAIACLGLGNIFGVDLPQYGIPLLIVSALIASACVHLYDKTIRWFIQGCAIFAVCLSMANILPTIAIGASLVCWCGLSIKEYYCFRIRLIRITPFVLVLFWLCFAFSFWTPSPFTTYGLYISSCLSALLLLTIGIAKFRQPFHFDIGDKNKFQV